MIYFDNSATTKMVDEATDTYVKVTKTIFGNPSSLHQLGTQANQVLEQSRKQVASLLGVKTEEIVFTSSGTEGDNWVIKGTAMEKRPYGNHIITTQVEHPAVLKSMQQLERFGFEVTYLPVNEKGVVDPEQVRFALKNETILVSVMAVNNEVGAIQPIDAIGEILEAYPTVHFHVDAVQAIQAGIPLPLNNRVDFAVYSAHKFRGPKGVGIVYHKKGRRLESLLSGGGQESGLRSATENVPAIASTAKALRLALENQSKKIEHVQRMKDSLVHSLSKSPTVQIFSSKEGAAHILCFALEGVRGEVMVHALEAKGIIVSTTSACSSKKGDFPATLQAMAVPSSLSTCAIRISLAPENTMEEVAAFLKTWDELEKKFQRIQ